MEKHSFIFRILSGRVGGNIVQSISPWRARNKLTRFVHFTSIFLIIQQLHMNFRHIVTNIIIFFNHFTTSPSLAIYKQWLFMHYHSYKAISFIKFSVALRELVIYNIISLFFSHKQQRCGLIQSPHCKFGHHIA